MILLLAFGGIAYAWTGPSGSPPNNNAAAPINIGATDQEKDGGLYVTNLLEGDTLAVWGGSAILAGNSYLNFGSTVGSSGYGIRNNAGTLEFKNSTGSWTPFAAGSGLVWLASGNNIYNTNTGNVGVGITAPGAKLEVKSSGNSTVFRVARSGSAHGYTVTESGGNLTHELTDGGSNTLTIGSGINLNVNNGGAVNIHTGAASGVGVTTIGSLRTVFSGGNVAIGNFTPGIKLAIGDSDTGLHWHSDGNMGLYTNNVERMRIGSNGSIGIGNSSPAQKLHVTGNVRADGFCIGTSCITTWGTGSVGGTGTTNRIPKFTAATTLGDSQIFDNGTDVGLGTAAPTIKLAIGDTDTGFDWVSDGNIALYTNNAERMRFSSAGNVGIGSNNPTHRLTVQGPASTGVDAIRATVGIQNNSTYAVMGIAGSYWGALGRGDGYAFVGNGDTYASGTAYANSFVYISDERLKENVAPLGMGLEEILKLRPVTYTWKDGADLAGRDDFGLIAQEVELVIPGAIQTRADGYKAVDYPRLIPVLVKALQEQQAQIDALKAEVAAIKGAH